MFDRFQKVVKCFRSVFGHWIRNQKMDSISIYKCRLCLNRTSRKVDIFKHDFPKMIELLTGLKVDPNDGLPKESCLDCARDVKYCMSVRKQILQSYKNLLKLLVEPRNVNNPLEDTLTAPIKRTLTNRKIRKKRPKSPESCSDEERDDYSEYSDNSEEERGDPDDEETEDNNVIEKITLIEPKEEDLVKNEVKPEYEDVKPENAESTERKTEIAEQVQSIQPLSPERLLKKRNLIAASNRIQNQDKTVGDRRYSNVIFIRKTRKEKLKHQARNDGDSKSKKEKSDDGNVIWKNGKKYAACEICKREVKKHYLKHHMTTHFPEHFSCDICGVTTRNLRGLRYHKLYWHSSKLDYICDKCGKKYRSKHALDLHNKKEHGGERDLECNICGKKFFQKMHLKRHVDGIHKKLRPHKCEYCGKDFSKRTHLVTHWRTHTNETPYSCDMCGERFKLKLSLKNHLRRIHNYEEKDKVFCNICNKGFASEQGLRAHINSRIHEGEKCQYCSESFTPEYLKVHMREVHMHVDFY